ncbi:MAG: hypothetical protein AAGF78_05755 [Pseudomonadota bacterium]
MHVIADTSRLTEEGIIDAAQAREIEARGREAMVRLAINTILCGGILAATGGLIWLLGTPFSVALAGLVFIGGGVTVLRKSQTFAMFGQAATLIGAGLLTGGATAELLLSYADVAAPALVILGGLLAALMVWVTARWPGFVTGSILLMGLAMHLGGLGYWLVESDASGITLPATYLYAALVLAAAGWWLDVRFVTALALIPFAQMLATSTDYWRATYAFYSPESTLSILQMAALTAAALWVAAHASERTARHAMILAVMAFIIANMCALVGSLWGDIVGETIWGPGYSWEYDGDFADWNAARTEFRATALRISDGVYSVLWALALAVMVVWGALHARRGVFNVALTFAGIHAYTQLFETFGDEPLAYVIGGLGAIPVAWGLWRANRWLATA